MASLWWFNNNADTLTILITNTDTNANVDSTTVNPNTVGVAGTAGLISGAAYQPYCDNSKATNFDGNFSDNNSPNIKVKIKSVSPSSGTSIWGLR